MNSEMMSFDDAARELGVSEEELEQLVAAGEIASLKDGDTVVFKKNVVQKFKKSQGAASPSILMVDEDIDLLDDGLELEPPDEGTTPAEKPGKRPAAPAPKQKAADEEAKPARLEIPLDNAGLEGGGLDELGLDDGGLDELGLEDIVIRPKSDSSDTVGADETADLESAKGSGKGGKKAEAKSKKRKAEADDETMLNLDGVLEEDSEGTTPVPGSLEVDADSTLLDTDDLLDVEGLGGGKDPFAADTVEEGTGSDLTEAGTLLRGGGARAMQMKRRKSHAAWTVVLAAACIVLMIPVGILTNLLFVHSPRLSQASEEPRPTKDSYGWILEYNVLDGVVQGVADVFVKE